ncbi:hypothetical protein BC829DRAFT_204964 [Chytridium lagenaria]|nr:hypothetical protein BC829DRAFT_204964 [Chytridium lagenaria]
MVPTGLVGEYSDSPGAHYQLNGFSASHNYSDTYSSSYAASGDNIETFEAVEANGTQAVGLSFGEAASYDNSVPFEFGGGDGNFDWSQLASAPAGDVPEKTGNYHSHDLPTQVQVPTTLDAPTGFESQNQANDLFSQSLQGADDSFAFGSETHKGLLTLTRSLNRRSRNIQMTCFLARMTLLLKMGQKPGFQIRLTLLKLEHKVTVIPSHQVIIRKLPVLKPKTPTTLLTVVLQLRSSLLKPKRKVIAIPSQQVIIRKLPALKLITTALLTVIL